MKKHKIQVVYPIDAGGDCCTREYYSESEDWKSRPSALGNALATLIARGVAVSLCKPYLKKRKAAKKREEPITPLPPDLSGRSIRFITREEIPWTNWIRKSYRAFRARSCARI